MEEHQLEVQEDQEVEDQEAVEMLMEQMEQLTLEVVVEVEVIT